MDTKLVAFTFKMMMPFMNGHFSCLYGSTSTALSLELLEKRDNNANSIRVIPQNATKIFKSFEPTSSRKQKEGEKSFFCLCKQETKVCTLLVKIIHSKVTTQAFALLREKWRFNGSEFPC